MTTTSILDDLSRNGTQHIAQAQLKVIGSDETGYRADGENWWLWKVQMPCCSMRWAGCGACLDLYSAQLNTPVQRFDISDLA